MSSKAAIHNAVEHLERRQRELQVEAANVSDALTSLRALNGAAPKAPKATESEWVTIAELAQRLGTSREAAYMRLREGSLRKLPRRFEHGPGRGGRYLLVNAAELDD